MSLKGKGAVAIWHDLLPEAKDEFYQWHNRQHMPERVAIPGFIRGRRYRTLGGAPEYFNLYEADTLATLGGADYLARLNDPTDWTRAVVASFRGVARSTCDVRYSDGIGDGGYVATLRFTATGAQCDDLAARALPALLPRSGVAAVHLLAADERTSTIETRERAARGDATEVPRHVVLIEGSGQLAVEDAAAAVRDALGDPVVVATGSYVLEHVTGG